MACTSTQDGDIPCEGGKDNKEESKGLCGNEPFAPGVLTNTGRTWIKTVKTVLMAPPLKCCDCIPPAQPCPEEEEEDEVKSLGACRERLNKMRGLK